MARRKGTSKPPSGLPTYPRPDLSPPELVIGSLAALGVGALASNEYRKADGKAVELNDEGREAIERAVGQLNELELHRFIEQMTIRADIPEEELRKQLDAWKRVLVERIGRIAGAAYIIGTHCAMAETSRVFFEQSRTLHMRAKRATKPINPEEHRLREAIHAEMKVLGLAEHLSIHGQMLKAS
jgi:hypothetical protein